MKRGAFKNKGLAWWPILAIVGLVGGGLWYWFRGGLVGMALDLFNFLSRVALAATHLLFNLLSQVAAVIINFFSVLDPFGNYGFASILWEFFKNIAYVALVFLALRAGFEWIFNREDEAKRMLFGILLIAFLINFTFILAREIFMAVWYLQRGILLSAGLYTQGTDTSRLGDLIYAALSLVPPKEMVGKIPALIPELMKSSGETSSGAIHNMEAALIAALQLLGILLNVIYSLIMWIFAGIFIGRFLIISFLIGVLPLACVAYTTPQYKDRWEMWWKMFLTWNFNVLILIVLIIIGISLIATNQTKFNEQNLANLFLQQQNASGLLQNITQDAATALGVITKFVFIGLYFLFVLLYALRLGGRAAEYSYNLGLKVWGEVGGAAAWVGREAVGKYARNLLGEPISKLGNVLVMNKYGIVRSLGSVAQNLGASMKQPLQKDIEAQARNIWEQLKDKSPDEIAGIIQRYPAYLQKEIARLAEREKSADEIIKVASRLNLQEAHKRGFLRPLCGRTLDCNLTRLITGTQDEKIAALNQIVSRLDWRTASLDDLSEVLRQVGIEDTKQQSYLLANAYPYVTNVRNFWKPANIDWLARQQQTDFIEAHVAQIRGTPYYRAAVEGGAADIARILGITDPNTKKRIQGALEGFFKKGELEGKLKEWQEQFSEKQFGQFTSDIGLRPPYTISDDQQQQLQFLFTKLLAVLTAPPTGRETELVMQLRQIKQIGG